MIKINRTTPEPVTTVEIDVKTAKALWNAIDLVRYDIIKTAVGLDTAQTILTYWDDEGIRELCSPDK
jgi:hypothetical protein